MQTVVMKQVMHPVAVKPVVVLFSVVPPVVVLFFVMHPVMVQPVVVQTEIVRNGAACFGAPYCDCTTTCRTTNGYITTGCTTTGYATTACTTAASP